MHDTCKEVSKHIRKLLNKKDEYEVDEVLICREYFKIKKLTFNVNFEYKIISVNSDSLVLKSISNNEELEIPIKTIRSHFIFNYCGTGHSQQGATIDGNITSFDYKHFFVMREWLWVSITRATNLDNVYFYDYSYDEEFQMNLVHSYFNRKIKGYKSQDREATREIYKNNYINVDWLMDCVNKRCSNCNSDFYINFDTGNTTSNITADRIRCNEDHNLDNIKPLCRFCNCAKSNN
jgi:hypothetical protein